MPKQELCVYCRIPIDLEVEEFVDTNQHRTATRAFAHIKCYNGRVDVAHASVACDGK